MIEASLTNLLAVAAVALCGGALGHLLQTAFAKPRNRQLDRIMARRGGASIRALSKADAQQSLRERVAHLSGKALEKLSTRVAALAEGQHMAHRFQAAGLRGPNLAAKFYLAKVGAAFLALVGFYWIYASTGALLTNPGRSYSVILGVSGFGFFLPNILLADRAMKRSMAIKQTWPDALDLLIVCVESGLSIEQAMRRVASQMVAQGPELAEELTITLAELAYLQDRRQAYVNLAERTQIEAVRSVCLSLVQAERQGTSIGHSLRVSAQINREERILAAEQKAAALGPKLTVPMILFFLPVLFVVIIAPVFLQTNL